MHRPDKRLGAHAPAHGRWHQYRADRAHTRACRSAAEIYSAIADLRQRLAAIETARTESPVIPSLDDINARLSALEHGIAAVDGSAACSWRWC